MERSDIPALRSRLAAAPSDEERLRTIILLADRLLSFDCREALSLAEDAFDIATRLNDPTGIARGLSLMGCANSYLGDNRIAIEQLKEACTYFETSNDSEDFFSTTNIIANIYAEMGEYAASMVEYHRIELLVHELKTPRLAAQFHNDFGLTLSELGDFSTTMAHFQQALEIGERERFDDITASVIGNMGKIHMYHHGYDQALELFQRARALSETTGYRHQVALWTESTGEAYASLGKLTEALDQYQLARNLAEETGNRLQQMCAIGAIGDVHRRLGNYTAAMENLLQAISIAEEGGLQLQTALLSESIGKLYITNAYKDYDPDRGEQFLQRAAQLLSEIGNKVELWRVYAALSDLYHDRGRLSEAFECRTMSFELYQEVVKSEIHLKAQQMEHRRQIAEMEKQRAIEQAEARAAEETQRMKSEQTQRELGNATLQLLAQTELLRDLRQDLLKIARKIPPTESAARELRERVKKLPCEAVDWEKYDGQFRAVHPDFMRSLLERAPDLTPTEVRICTMLRMNLKSHEIATLFCITETGVNFHRTNIRRKLKLEREEKLPLVLGAM